MVVKVTLKDCVLKAKNQSYHYQSIKNMASWKPTTPTSNIWKPTKGLHTRHLEFSGNSHYNESLHYVVSQKQ